MKINQILKNSRDLFPEKAALIHGRRSLSYETLFAQAEAVARGLVQHGVKKGDRVQ